MATSRTFLATQVFPQHIERWEEWLQFIEEFPFPFIKLDTFGVRCMNGEDFSNDLVRALRWFDSGSDPEFRSLLWLAGIKYDVANARVNYNVAKRDFTWQAHQSPGLYLQGAAWQREVPWEVC